MQQTTRAKALAFAVQFSPILFEDHEPDCECPNELVTAIHKPKCKIVKKGRCTCKPVFVHALVVD